MKANLTTLRAFSALITGEAEIKYADPEWLNTGELRWDMEKVVKSTWFTSKIDVKKTLQQKWVCIHAGEIIKTEWRNIPEWW